MSLQWARSSGPAAEECGWPRLARHLRGFPVKAKAAGPEGNDVVHILWPAYTIGVSGFIVILAILGLRTRRPVYRDLLRFWIHLFALGFAMGVVTGLVMSYQIGTNWSVFAERTANVIGPFSLTRC